jgi:hypothetical protein
MTFDFGNGPVAAHQHPNGGGWVANTATVGETAYVGPEARVFGRARVSGGARVCDRAAVSGEAQVFGRARVSGGAQVYGDAWVGEHAWVYGDAQVAEHAWVYGGARVYGKAWVYGEAWVFGRARVSGEARVSGKTVLNLGSHIGEPVPPVPAPEPLFVKTVEVFTKVMIQPKCFGNLTLVYSGGERIAMSLLGEPSISITDIDAAISALNEARRLLTESVK